MSNFNKVILMGNLTRDPELRYIPSGQAVCSFSLALNNKYTSNGETREDVSYIDIVVFGKQGENCNQYLGRGRSALVEGRLQQRRWEAQDGQKRSKVEVVAQSVTFMPKQGSQNSNAFPYDKNDSGSQGNQGSQGSQDNQGSQGNQGTDNNTGGSGNNPVNLNDVPF